MLTWSQVSLTLSSPLLILICARVLFRWLCLLPLLHPLPPSHCPPFRLFSRALSSLTTFSPLLSSSSLCPHTGKSSHSWLAVACSRNVRHIYFRYARHPDKLTRSSICSSHTHLRQSHCRRPRGHRHLIFSSTARQFREFRKPTPPPSPFFNNT